MEDNKQNNILQQLGKYFFQPSVVSYAGGLLAIIDCKGSVKLEK